MIKIHKYEAIGIGLSIGAMALALFLLRLNSGLDGGNTLAKSAESSANQAAAVTAGSVEDAPEAIKSALRGDRVTKLVITDITLGTGDAVKQGDTVTVNYIGTLQNGQEFDNSYKKGDSFTFKVGDNKVIAGWNQGLLGMKVGGQRVLIVPSDQAYGKDGYGPVPGNATVVYAIQLLAIE